MIDVINQFLLPYLLVVGGGTLAIVLTWVWLVMWASPGFARLSVPPSHSDTDYQGCIYTCNNPECNMPTFAEGAVNCEHCGKSEHHHTHPSGRYDKFKQALICGRCGAEMHIDETQASQISTLLKESSAMCKFQYGTIECRGDGFCWDADNDGYDPEDESMPCPACNTAVWLQQQKEEAETTSSYSNNAGFGTGVSIWENAVAVAMQANGTETLLIGRVEALLIEIGQVKALYEDEAGNVRERVFNYHATF